MPKDNISESFHSELNALRDQAGAQIKFALAKWLIRWLIGFGIIAAITSYYPSSQWLWIAGLVIASLSLSFTLVAYAVLRLKMARVSGRMQAALKDIQREE